MATWLDGPEYAPGERPAAFVVPPVAPLESPAAAAVPGPSAPTAEPTFSAPGQAQPELAALVPAAAPGRNPRTPFDVSAAAITAGSAPGPGGTATAVRLPTDPFPTSGGPVNGYAAVTSVVQPGAQINPTTFPAPNTPQWFAPPPTSRVPPAPAAVTMGQIWRAVTPGVLVPLLIGMVFSWFSPLMLAVSFALSARIAYRRDAVRRSYVVALVLLAMIAVGSILADGYQADQLFETLSAAAQVACIILPIVVGLIVGAALRAGERPDRIS